MKYTLEEIYNLVGKGYKTAGLTFYPGTESYEIYGSYLVVVFLYNQFEMQEMDELIKKKPFSLSGYIKARYLNHELPPEKILRLKTIGVKSDDIYNIDYFGFETANVYHSEEVRKIDTININVKPLPKGRDFDWWYGFTKNLVSKGIGLAPNERHLYLAMKLYFEPDQLTELESSEIYNTDNSLKENVEFELLYIKTNREEITADELKRAGELLYKRRIDCVHILNKYLAEAGTSFQKLGESNVKQLTALFTKVLYFKERRLNTSGKIAIYADLETYLHIFMRHVKEMKIENSFMQKDNFQWDESDVFMVMTNIVQSIEDEIQQFFTERPGVNYGRYGRESIYFEGDYYTVQIMSNGRIATFHKNRKSPTKRNQ